jgi:hypothetical protein
MWTFTLTCARPGLDDAKPIDNMTPKNTLHLVVIMSSLLVELPAFGFMGRPGGLWQSCFHVIDASEGKHLRVAEPSPPIKFVENAVS